MFSAKTTIGHNYQKRFGRDKRKQTVCKASQKRLPQQEKLPEVVVEYNPYDEPFSLVEYFCPICNQKLWLGHSNGCRNIVCSICGEEYILDIRRIYN